MNQVKDKAETCTLLCWVLRVGKGINKQCKRGEGTSEKKSKGWEGKGRRSEGGSQIILRLVKDTSRIVKFLGT